MAKQQTLAYAAECTAGLSYSNPLPMLNWHNILGAEPPESHMPGCSSEQVPIFFGEYHAPKEGFILLAVTFQDHL